MSTARGQWRYTFLLFAWGMAAAQTPVSITHNEWTIMADPVQSALTLKSGTLGVVMQNVRLCVNRPDGRHELKQWQVQTNNDELNISTREPATAWSFQLGENSLNISSTEYDALLTAEAPAPPNRILARLMDPEGALVDWVGTGEVAGTYGGSFTHNRSFLPRRNPDVMYFTLGQTQGSAFHSLFDR